MSAETLPYSATSAATSAAPRLPLWLPALSLAKRELVRFLRQKHRIIGALATPIVFWLLIGGGMGRSFQSPGNTASQVGQGGYLAYFYPGTVLMILLFTAIFSTISIIEDRREGFLQSVLVAPISPLAIVLGKVLGGTALAFGQGLIFLLLSPLVGFGFTFISFLLAVLIMFITAMGLTALGFCIAWRMSSTQGFHAIMNLFLMPMWFLSGALFPAEGAWVGLKYVIYANPLSYGLSGLRTAMDWRATGGDWGAYGISLGISVLFAGALMLLAAAIARTRIQADLQ